MHLVDDSAFSDSHRCAIRVNHPHENNHTDDIRFLRLASWLWSHSLAVVDDSAAQYPLAHQRGSRPAHGLLRRYVRHHAQHRRVGGQGNALSALLVERCRSAHRHGRRSSPACTRRARAASTCGAWCLVRRASRCFRNCCAGPATTARTTPRKITTSATRPGLGRIVEESALEEPPGRPALLCGLQLREKSRKQTTRAAARTDSPSPAQVRVPAYHPDTPEVRQDWAQYYDTVTEADADAGKRLRRTQQAGLADDTIVFYFADHGSGMPRNKRWPREVRPARAAGGLHP